MAQSAYEGKGENRLNVAWAFYGRGNGLSMIYDHGFNDWFSAGVGAEVYVIEDESEFSYFGVVDFHLKELLGLPERLDLYPGAEVGSFEQEFKVFPYLGIAFALRERFGLYTEIGERATVGIYYNF